MTSTILMRSVHPGHVVQDEHGQWQTVINAHWNRDTGYATLTYSDGTEEEGPGGAPCTVLPNPTGPQVRLLARVADGHIVEGMQGKPYDETLTHPPTSKIHAASLRRLVDADLVRAVRARPGSTARTHVYCLTDTGSAVLAARSERRLNEED